MSQRGLCACVCVVRVSLVEAAKSHTPLTALLHSALWKHPPPKLVNVLERLRKVGPHSHSLSQRHTRRADSCQRTGTTRRQRSATDCRAAVCWRVCVCVCVCVCVAAASVCQSGPMALMAEIKRASPSLGDINVHIDPAQQAVTYAKGGAAVISVLTEPKWCERTHTHSQA